MTAARERGTGIFTFNLVSHVQVLVIGEGQREIIERGERREIKGNTPKKTFSIFPPSFTCLGEPW